MDELIRGFELIGAQIQKTEMEPTERATAIAALLIAKTVVTDLHRIANAQEAMAAEYLRIQAGTK